MNPLCLCGYASWRPVVEIGVWTVARCRQCGLLRTLPALSPEALAASYPADYPPHQLAAPPTGRIRRYGSRRVWWVPQGLPPGSRVLEIGPGRGDFALVALRHGWVYTASTKVETDLPELVRLRQSYDLIVGWHVLEHLIHPDATLRQLARLLAPTGCLALSLPCAGTVWARLFGASWYDWQVPWHQWHFTRALLRWELEMAGFEVHHCWGQRTLKSLAGSTRRPWLGRILGHWLVSYLGGCLLSMIGQNPRMTLVATHETGAPSAWFRERIDPPPSFIDSVTYTISHEPSGGLTEQEWKA